MSNEDPTPPPVQTTQNYSQPPPVQATQNYSQPPTMGPGPSFIDSLVPAKNGNALLSYYLGLFLIFPLFGLAMGVVAIVLGRRGLKAARETPGLAGATHAKVGIGCGAIGFLFNLAIILFILAILIFGRLSF